MEIKKTLSNNLYTNFGKQQTPQNATPASNSEYADKKSAPTNAGLYQAYNNVSFKGKPYDGTNFRADLQKRAEHSTTKLRLFPEFNFVQNEQNLNHEWVPDENTPTQELELFKTKHSEYVQSTDGAKIYKIRYVEDKDRIIQQVFASKLYNLAGVRTPEYIAFEKDGKTGYLVEVLEEELFDAETNPKALYESFVADVWLGNRNGLSKGNTKIDKDGNPVKMSVSGSLGYRASGKPKNEKFSYSIEEINTMRDYSINADSALALSKMTDADLYDAIKTVTARIQYDKENEITGEYWPQDTFEHNAQNVIENRKCDLERFPKNDTNTKVLKKRGLLQKDTPNLSNLSSFDPSFNIDFDSVLKITDEQWDKLRERGLFTAKPGLKKFNMLDYSFLAQMTDEEHQSALKKGLYAPCKNDETIHDNIGGCEISQLSKLNDKQWETVKKTQLA